MYLPHGVSLRMSWLDDFAICLFSAPVGRNDAFRNVLRPLSTVGSMHFPSHVGWVGWVGGVGCKDIVEVAHMLDAT